MKLVITDGGRSEAGFNGHCGDCVTRAITLATGMPYESVWEDLTTLKNRRQIRRTDADTGMPFSVCVEYLTNYIGSKFVSCNWKYGNYVRRMGVDCETSYCNYNTKTIEEVVGNKGTYILQLRDHMVCVRDGVFYDTWDSRGKRAKEVYGYWKIEY